MAAETSRTLFHYTPKRINALYNRPADQLKLVSRYGKPLGFWYAYGTNWRNLVEAGHWGQLGRSVNTVGFRYEVVLPEESFVSEVESATPNTILELSATNLDTFMERFHDEQYHYSYDMIIDSAFHVFVTDGGSAILNEIAEADETGRFLAFLNRIQKEIETQENSEDRNLDGDLEVAYSNFNELFEDIHPSSTALRKDGISNYDWDSFWKGVASSIGGVEFHTNLFTIKEWNGLWLPWTDTLDVRSGVIFHPNQFRDGVLTEQILQVDPVPSRSGGRRRTRRGRGLGRGRGRSLGRGRNKTRNQRRKL